jgi:hypothetical protein
MDELAAGASVLSRPAEEFGNDVSTTNIFLYLCHFLDHGTHLNINNNNSPYIENEDNEKHFIRVINVVYI